jgi:hypothetical protein
MRDIYLLQKSYPSKEQDLTFPAGNICCDKRLWRWFFIFGLMKAFLTALVIITSLPLFSQNSGFSAKCIPFWRNGENKIYHITRIIEKFERGELKSKHGFSYEAHITVLDSSASSYTVQWIFHLPQKVKSENPGLADSLVVYEGMKMIYKASRSGVFIELINWQEVRDSYVKMMELSLPKNLDSAAKTAVEQSKALFNSKGMAESALIREIQIFHFAYGNEFTTTEKKLETQLPNPFSGAPLPAVQTYKLSELNLQAGYFTLNFTQDIDKVGAQTIFESVFKKMNLPDDKAISEAKRLLSSLEISDHSEYKFFLLTGWPKYAHYTRTTKSEQMNQIDSMIIEMED